MNFHYKILHLEFQNLRMEQKISFENSSLDYILPESDIPFDALFIVSSDDNIWSFADMSVARPGLSRIHLVSLIAG